MLAKPDSVIVKTHRNVGERIGIAIAALWLPVVLYFKFSQTPLLADRFFPFVRAYRDFHLWHSYSIKALAGLAVAIWIIWIVVQCGGHLLRKLIPDAELTSLERRLFSAGLGFFLVSTATLVLGALRLWYIGVFWLVLIGATIAYLPRKVPKVNWNVSLPSITATREWWTKAAIACLVLAGLLILVNDLSPEIFFDSLHYHLALPNLYLVNHRVYNEPNFELSGLVMNVQMLWGFGLTLGNELTPKLLHGATLLLLFLTFIAFERRYLSTGAGLLGTLIFVTMPIVAGVAGTAGIDVASGALQFLALFALTLAIAETRNDSTERRWIRLAGLLTGVAATCKFTSVSTIPIAWALIFARHIQKGQPGKTALRAAWSFLLYAALAMFPFYLKNAVFYHNPVYPVAGTSWGTPRVTVENWNRVQGDVGAPASLSPVALASRLFLDPWRITMNGTDGIQNFIGPMLLGLIPLILFIRPIRPPVLILACYSLALWLVWLVSTTEQVRYGIPLLAMVSLLAAEAVVTMSDWPVVRNAVLGLCILTAFWDLYYVTLLTVTKDGWRVVGGMISEADYLDAPHVSYPAPDHRGLSWMNGHLPQGSKIMMVGDSRTFYTRLPVVPSSVYDNQPLVEAARNASNGAGMAAAFRAQGVTHLFVNLAESVRTESYGIYPWDQRSWATLDDFWANDVRLVWASALGGSAGPYALLIYEIRPEGVPPGPDWPAPPNPFVRWKPKS